METFKVYDKDRPGAEEHAKHRARCHWMRARLKREGQAAVQAAVDQLKEGRKEDLRQQGAHELCGDLFKNINVVQGNMLRRKTPRA